ICSICNRDQVQKSLKVAVRRNDLTVVEWLFAHFPGLNVTADVVKVATIKAEKSKPSEFVAGHVIHWNTDVMMSALHNDDPVIMLRWLQENMPEGDDERDIDREIRLSINNDERR
ncbi:hypothetical protein GN958_ATG18692, partial [Phytophthora infestans]